MNAPQPIKSHFATLAALNIGANHEGGKYAGLITLPDGKHVAVILLPNKADGELKWVDAMSWAESVGGQLPSRPIAALLFAHLKDEFEPEWHWTNESNKDYESYAWLCGFGNGYQSDDHEGNVNCARAVRLIHVED